MIEAGVIPKAAMLAAREHGDARKANRILRNVGEHADARKANRILRNVGEHADRHGYSTVREEHLDAAEHRPEGDCFQVLFGGSTPIRVFGVRLHSMGLSVREVTAVLDLLGVDRSHGATWNWEHRLADSGCERPETQLKRIAVDETAVNINDE